MTQKNLFYIIIKMRSHKKKHSSNRQGYIVKEVAGFTLLNIPTGGYQWVVGNLTI